jgi:polyketide biosynthesis enoyl-CoA hydratase PksH
MTPSTVLTQRAGPCTFLTLQRPASRNSLNRQLLTELNDALDASEHDPDTRVVVLQGAADVFCTGMDLREALQDGTSPSEGAGAAPHELYLRTLKRFTLSPRIIVARVDGVTLAGGVGLVAAADFALGGPACTFALSEALWGLLPACVLPFLVRRVGFQRAYAMTLGTQTIGAARACEIGLLDELCVDLDAGVRRLTTRLTRLDPATVLEAKRYFRRLWILSEATEAAALEELTMLMGTPRVRANLRAFVDEGRFPWEPR